MGNQLSTSKPRTVNVGVLAFIAGVVAAGSEAMIGFTSFTAFNPPNWLRIATMLPLPFALVLAFVFGLLGLRWRSGSAWAVGGLVLGALVVVGFFFMLSRGG